MFEVGFTELLLICGLALIVLGPQRLPELAAKIGNWVGRARAMARQLSQQLEHEARAVDLSREMKDMNLNEDLDLSRPASEPPRSEIPPRQRVYQEDEGISPHLDHSDLSEPEPPQPASQDPASNEQTGR